MSKTVKELIKEEIEYWLDDDTYEFSVSTIKSDIKGTLEMILEEYEKEIQELKQNQLKKSDFIDVHLCSEISDCEENCNKKDWLLKDNTKYNTLEEK